MTMQRNQHYDRQQLWESCAQLGSNQHVQSGESSSGWRIFEQSWKRGRRRSESEDLRVVDASCSGKPSMVAFENNSESTVVLSSTRKGVSLALNVHSEGAEEVLGALVKLRTEHPGIPVWCRFERNNIEEVTPLPPAAVLVLREIWTWIDEYCYGLVRNVGSHLLNSYVWYGADCLFMLKFWRRTLQVSDCSFWCTCR